MNLRLLLGAWAIGVVVIAVMIVGERAAAARFRRIADGVDTVGIVTARGLAGGTYKSTVFDVDYTDSTGARHQLRKVALTGHVTIGSSLTIRYSAAHPENAAPAPQHTTSPRWQVFVALAVFGALGLALGLAG
jgi:hypothetical protein